MCSKAVLRKVTRFSVSRSSTRLLYLDICHPKVISVYLIITVHQICSSLLEHSYL
jgi:hypothetical protein